MACPPRGARRYRFTGIGHPTKTITVSGTGFAASEPIDIYLDTVDSKLVFSNSSGAFSTTLAIPLETAPGSHTVSAIGRRANDA